MRYMQKDRREELTTALQDAVCIVCELHHKCKVKEEGDEKSHCVLSRDVVEDALVKCGMMSKKNTFANFIIDCERRHKEFEKKYGNGH